MQTPAPRTLAERRVIQLVSESRTRLALFLGAGASVSSGVPAAGAMIREWRQMAYGDVAPAEPFDAWCRLQPWFEQESEYSALFAELYPNPSLRQAYIERKVDLGSPGWGYLYLAGLIAHDWFRVALTTNFDNLLAEALSRYANIVPVVCAADSEVMSVNLTSQRPKVIKLHGDYLFPHQKHTVEELESLGGNMKIKFSHVARDHGLLVLGYGGRDRSIMGPLRDALADPAAFASGVYWGLWRDEVPASMVTELAAQHPGRFHLFRYHDFDGFAAALHRACELPLPDAVRDPHGTLKSMLRGLVADGRAGATTSIEEDRQTLQREVDRSELLAALVALARREHDTAARIATAFLQRHPDDAQGHFALGHALTQRAESTGNSADAAQAMQHLQQAVTLDAKNVASLQALTLHHMRAENDAQAIECAERLLEHMPNDKSVRTTLAELHLKRGHVAQAAQQIRACLERDPQDANLHALWSQLMVRNGNQAEALKAIDEAIRRKPHHAAFHSHRGQILGVILRMQDAIDALRQAVQLDPADHLSRLLLARCLLGTGAADAALQEAQAVRRGNPESTEATGLVAQLLTQRGEFAQALPLFDQLVDATPEDPRGWAMRGHVQMQMQQPARAEQDFLQALRLNPQDPQTLQALAWLYHASGRPDRLQGVMQQLHQASPQAAQWLQMQLQMGRPMQPPMQPMPQGAAPPASQSGQPLLQRFLDAMR